MSEPGGVNRVHNPSLKPKLAFALLHATSILACAWLAFGPFDWPDPTRATILFGCALLYFFRHLITLFVLLKRQVEYSEVFGLSIFMLVFEGGFLLLGAGILRTSPASFTVLDTFAVVLVLFGSFLNTGSELQRWLWKRKPQSKGHCYTQGLFAYSMHINYFGDILLFTGWAILTASLISGVIPLFITMGFVFYHIPPLDKYLTDRYGAEFEAYAARTAKLVPFIY